jgi:hypothetical protein
MGTPAKKPNGSKALRIPATCPHADDCASPRMHEQLMANIDQLGTSIGMLLESHEGLAARISQVHEEFLGHAKSATDCNAFIVTALRKLGGEDA